MSKIKLKIRLIGPEENVDLTTNGIKLNDKIKYKENNILVVINCNKDIIYMSRTCNEYEINLVFKKNTKTVSTYKVFGSDKIFQLQTLTNNLYISKNNISIDYNLEGNEFKFSLEVI